VPGEERDFDYIVIGSGFGGSVAAHRLTEKGYRVAVMEMGRRWNAENLPRTSWQVWRWIWRPKVALRGFFNLAPFRHVLILHGCAVGGGSITYASTAQRPKDCVWDMGSWARLAEWKREMPAWFDKASRMLGVTRNRVMGPADEILKHVAEAVHIEDTYYQNEVTIFEGREGESAGVTCPDPYFAGDGPERATCVGCGGCMMGCRYNAKNTLDKNYLYLAEKHGARVFPETRVVGVVPLGGSEDGSEGYEVRTVKSTAWIAKQPQRYTCRGVVFAASALGTMDLLFRLKQNGSLPAISDRMGNRVRTNAESLLAVRCPGGEDLSQGVAIGSGVHLDEHTHIEATRYPAGSDTLGLLATLLTGRRTGESRIALWLGTLASGLIRHPLKTLRCLHPFGFARETLILLCMQTLDGHIEMRLGRPWFWPFHKMLMSAGAKVPAFIPQANEFARVAAQMTGGTALSTVTEILFNIPTTAHILGGCPMSDSSSTGVVDGRNRVFGYRNMYICDGSVIAANLGVNPSLTICALSERAMGFVPAAGDARWDDRAA
jgi:cholesterol oxidase